MRAAWNWLWSFLTEGMALSLATAGEEYDLVQSSLDICIDNMSETEFGDLLFDNLQKYGPNVHPRGSPKQIMSLKLFEMVTTLVSFSGDDETMHEQVHPKPLTRINGRRVMYHTPVFITRSSLYPRTHALNSQVSNPPQFQNSPNSKPKF